MQPQVAESRRSDVRKPVDECRHTLDTDAILNFGKVRFAKANGPTGMTWIGPSAHRQIFTSLPETVQ